MKRYFFAILIYAATAYPFSGLEFTPESLYVGDTTILSGSYSDTGDTALFTAFADVNGNGSFDIDIDFITYSSEKDKDVPEFIDGNSEVDDNADGLLYIPLVAGEEGPLEGIGSRGFIMSDKNGSDTAFVTVLQDTTDLYLSGTVYYDSVPLPNLVAWAGLNEGEQFRAMVTDSNGTFLLRVPQSWSGDTLICGIEDFYEIYSDSLNFLPVYVETLLVDSLPGFEIHMKSVSHYIAGTVVDENGDPVAGMEVDLYSESGDIYKEVYTDSTGRFIGPAMPGQVYIQPDPDSGYMITYADTTFPDDADTFNVELSVIETDTVISGNLILPDGFDMSYTPDEDYNVSVSVEINGKKHYSITDWQDSIHFSAGVSSQIDYYEVSLWWDNLPSQYYVEPSYSDSVAPGSEMEFSLLTYDQIVQGVIIDENGDSVTDAVVYMGMPDGSGWVSDTTDSTGLFSTGISTGEWYVSAQSENYMTMDTMIVIDSSADTTVISLKAFSTDTSIKGRIVVLGSFDADLDEIIRFEATSYSDSMGGHYRSQGTILSDSSFEINVSTVINSTFRINVEKGWMAGEEMVIFPYSGYDDIPAGEDSVIIGISLQSGILSGTGYMIGSQDTGYTVEGSDDSVVIWEDGMVCAIDSSQSVYSTSYMDIGDGSYDLPLPAGTYNVFAVINGRTESDGIHYMDTVVVGDSIVINGKDKTIDFYTDSADVPVGPETIMNHNRGFSWHLFPNPLRTSAYVKFFTPVSGTAEIRVFDLKGKLITTLFNNSVKRGSYSVSLRSNLKDGVLNSGQYIMEINISGKEKYTKSSLFTIVK